MADILLKLKFDTSKGRKEIQKLSTDARAALTKAFQFYPKTIDLSRALGIKQAVTDTSRLRAEMVKLSQVMFGGPGGKVPARGLSFKQRELTQFSNLGGTAAGKALAGFGGSTRGRSGLIRNKLGQFQSVAGGGALPTKDVIAFQVQELAIRKMQTRESARAATNIAKAEAERVKAIQAETKAILQRIAQFAKKRDEFSRRQQLKQQGVLGPKQDDQRTNANIVRGQEALRQRQINEHKSKLEQIRGSRAKQRQIDEHESRLENIRSRAQQQRTEANKRKGQEALRQHQRQPGLFGRLFGGGGAGAAAVSGGRGGGTTTATGGRISPQQALGITNTATALLAASSVVAPIAPQLGATLMGAGFSAFSLGAPVAVLALLASALAGFIKVLKSGVSAAKEANLETVAWSRSTIKFKLEVQGFLKTIGVKTQQAFTPVVDKLTKVFKVMESLPWDDMIDHIANTASSFIDLGRPLAESAGAVSKLIASFKKSVNESYAAEAFQGFQDRRGLEGTQRVTFYDFIRNLTRSIEKMRAPDQTAGNRNFIFTPKFDMKSVEDIGNTIQKGILKDASKDPLIRALDVQSAIMRLDLKLNEKQAETFREFLESVNSRVPLRHLG